ncbi:hypothetical protein ACP4OV_027197 [Aristida adscensionis]
MDGDESSLKQLKIVSIVGCGGLGKTTLAKVVYDKLKDKFDCGAFVYVSLYPNMLDILKNMLHQLGNYKYQAISNEAQLIGELREFLRNNRYFIVIDDIWNSSIWEILKCALINNGCGSRIIITTRILDVAKQVGGVYQMEPLSADYPRKLFWLRVYGTEEGKCPPNHLIRVSENILNRCGGIPLAIITIGGMLADQ